jgi:hypothetical protein
MQLVIRDAQAARAQAPHDLGGAGLRALQAAAGGGAAIIRFLAKAVAKQPHVEFRRKAAPHTKG